MANTKKLAPKDKHKSKWWTKRNEARAPLQEQHAAALAVEAARSAEEEAAMLVEETPIIEEVTQ